MRKSWIVILLSIATTALAWDWWPLAYAPDKQNAGSDSIFYSGEVIGVASYGKEAPYFLRINRNGNIAPQPFSGNISAGIYKPATASNRWFDYDFAVQLTGRIAGGRQNIHGTGYFNQLYAHARLWCVDITAGIKPYTMGPQDDDLSGGGLLFSQNAHPMPRITIGIDDYTAFPGLFGYVEVKGGLTHGWFNDNNYITGGYLHHAYAGLRLGGSLPVRVAYEFHHAAQWGGISPQYGDLGNTFGDFMNALLARSGGTMLNDQQNAQGNHIGSQILSLEMDYNGWQASFYWHSMFEDGPIKFPTHAMNSNDGLWGLHIAQNHWPFISGLTYEFINTTDQAGPYHDRDGLIYGGGDCYFVNSIYQNGWTYFGQTIGTPYIQVPNNNRVMAHFVGVRGDIYGYKYRLLTSYAQNFGTYSQPNRTQNTALLLEVTKHVEQAWGLDFSVAIATDIGNQYSNTFGAMITIAKHGLITTY